MLGDTQIPPSSNGRLMAENAFEMVSWLLTVLPDCEPLRSLRASHEARRGTIIERLVEKRRLCALIEHNHIPNFDQHLTSSEVVSDASILLSFYTTVSIMLLEYPWGHYKDTIKNRILLKKLLRSLARAIVEAVKPQLDPIIEIALQIDKHLRKHNPEAKRLLFLEFPIGNTVPTIVLSKVLRDAGYEIKSSITSLNRNDKPGVGITREDCLKYATRNLSNGAWDLVIYVDEWISGSNFHNICKQLTRIFDAPDLASIPFVPIALLKNTAAGEKRFSEYARKHDAMLQRAGFDIDLGRTTLPSLPTKHDLLGYFFWGENDRLAGYRKYQPLSVSLSGMDFVIQQFITPENREKLLNIKDKFYSMIEAMMEGPLHPSIPHPSDQAFLDNVQRGYDDYVAIKPKLLTIEATTTSSFRPFENADIAELLEETAKKIEKITEGRPCSFLCKLALFYIQFSKNFDFIDPYLIPGHIPALLRLEGDANLPHQFLSEEISSYLKSKK